jgi:UDP-2,3-diacylglucosamine hydrolase
MKKHNVNYLVHGHTHRPNVHHFNLNDSEATRIVLGAWHDEAHILIWEESGRKNLLTFSQWFNHEQFGYETPHD